MTGYSIDWDKVKSPYKRFRWRDADEQQTICFLRQTKLSNFEDVCFVYGAYEPGLIVKFENACEYFEDLAIFGRATHFMVGMKRDLHGFP